MSLNCCEVLNCCSFNDVNARSQKSLFTPWQPCWHIFDVYLIYFYVNQIYIRPETDLKISECIFFILFYCICLNGLTTNLVSKPNKWKAKYIHYIWRLSVCIVVFVMEGRRWTNAISNLNRYLLTLQNLG